jgi:Na+/H+-dicarboxylate symporter
MASPEGRGRASDSHRTFVQILWGLGAGTLLGLFLGEAVGPLEIASTGFLKLLQINVLPYLLGSLIASLGRHTTGELKVIARYGFTLLLAVWAAALLLVVLCPLALPAFGGTPVFGVEAAPASFDWLDLYIPTNLFHALTNNLIPAVVLFGILAGVALGQMSDDRKSVLLQTLGAFNEAMSRVSRFILRLTPFGLFAIAAVTAGQLRGEDVLRLQVWLHFYGAAALILTLWVVPGLVSRLSPVPYARFLRAMRSAIVTAAAVGDVFVVLPIIAESAKELLVEQGADPARADRAVGVAVPLLYNFPHAGKILSLAFLPFAAWYSGSSLDVEQMGLLLSAGPLSLFGNINAAIPFLLDLVKLPADVFELFTMSSVVNSRFGSMTAAAHTAALSVLVAAAILGTLRVSARQQIARFIGVTAIVMAVFIGGTRAVFTWMLPPAPSGLETLSPFALRAPLVASATVPNSPSATPPHAGQRLQEIKARGVLRVGYFADAVPWAFVNAAGELVGYDIEAAHRLAAQLGVRLEFASLRRTPPEPSHDLASGRVDVLMTGFTATVSRAGRMELSHPYGSENVGFLVRDFDRRHFETLEALNEGEGLVIAVPPVELAADDITRVLPKAMTRQYQSVDEVLEDPEVTATLMTLERASYWSRVRPEFAAVRPEELQTATIVVYALPLGEIELRNLVDLWIETRKASGEADEAYQYWIRGKALTRRAPRWSIASNVLGWW